MGCWNTTCGISNLPIFAGEEVVVFMLVENQYASNYVYHTDYFNPCLVPFYGKYNDYGSVEYCEGPALDYILKALKRKMTEFPLGENECHDLQTLREELTVEQMFEFDHDNRLYINGYYHKGDRNSANQKPAPKHWGQRVVHVQIKKSIFDYILNNYVITKYMPNKEDYTKAYYKDFNFEDAKNDPELSAALLYEQLPNRLLSVREITEHPELFEDSMKAGFFNRFMDDTRTTWIKPTGNGSQSSDPKPYRVLIAAMTEVLDEEKKEHDEEDYD